MDRAFQGLFWVKKGWGFLVVLGLCVLSSGCSADAKEEDKSSTEAKDTLSLESAFSMAEAEYEDTLANEREQSLEEMYRLYEVNNAIAADPDASCNQGREPLSSFVDSFLKSRRFRASRLKTADGGAFYTDTLRPYTLRVLFPDSTGFFASWNYVSADTAAFLSGWLNSEVLEEITLVRESEEKEWQVVDYYSSI